MNLSLRHSLFTFISVILVITLVTSACTQPQEPVIGLNPILSVSDAPVLGKPVKVTLTFTTVRPKGLEDRDLFFTASISVPREIYEIVDGSLELKGNMKTPGETHTLKATIKAIKTGVGTIDGAVVLHFGDNNIPEATERDQLIIQITKEDARVRKN